MSIIKNVTGTSHNKDILKKALDYCTEAYKTRDGKYVRNLGCSEDAVGSMGAIKRIFHKEEGRQFEESMLSITPAGNQYTDDELMNIGIECAEFWYRKGFQVSVTLHLDSEFRHFHFVINSVSFNDGRKIKISPADYNAYKTHCSRVLHSYGLDPIRTPAAKILDTTPHNFDVDLKFFEFYDEVMADNGKCLLEMLAEQQPSTTYPNAAPKTEYINPDAPTSNGPNRFMLANDPNYRYYWQFVEELSNKEQGLGWSEPFFEPWNLKPMTPPSFFDLLPKPVIVHETVPGAPVQDEYYFNDKGALLRINCSRSYEVTLPDSYTENQIKYIIEHLPRMSDSEKNMQTKRATAASATFKNKNIDGQVELDLSETIRLNWSDGTSTTVALPDMSSEEDSDNDIIDVDAKE